MIKYENSNTNTLSVLFEQQVFANPDNISVIFNNNSLTYKELNDRANRIAHWLLANNIGSEDIVCIMLTHSFDLLSTLLGVLKSGAAYLPLDPAYPAERLTYILKDSKPKCLITNRELGKSLNFSGQTFCLDSSEQLDILSNMSNFNPTDWHRKKHILPEQSAYVIYTSGSTGQPKGVVISQNALFNFLQSMETELNISSHEIFLSTTSSSFDISGLEFYLPIICGAVQHLISRDISLDGQKLSKYIQKFKPTFMQGTPAFWQLLREAEWSPSKNMKLLCGGEAISPDLANYLCGIPNSTVWNMYGPTETTIWSLISPLKINYPVSIGRPIRNTQIYILDEMLRPVPIGNVGELYISGSGLSRGYLKKPKLTAERFVACPFENKGSRMYRTGDFVRLNNNGEIEYQGRADDQIKLRGFRIELGEIEAVCMLKSGVMQAKAIVQDTLAGQKQLAVYLVLFKNSKTTINEFRNYLKQYLPDYMIPTVIIVLEKLPLTANGKLDRNALKSLSFRPQERRMPRNQTEEVLAQVFTELLNLERVGIDENFFELGGNSLLATRLLSKLRILFRVELPIFVVFDSPTIAELVCRFNDSLETRMPLKPMSRFEHNPLSYAQQRLWFLNQLEGKSATYNIPTAIHINGEVDFSALQFAFNNLIQKHEILRTRFKVISSDVEQEILPKKTTLNIQKHFINDVNLNNELKHYSEHCFNLTLELPIQVHLFCMGSNQFVLLIVIHHIASDGWSLAPLLNDIQVGYIAYRQKISNEDRILPVQYIDYTIWQRELLGHENDPQSPISKQLKYWCKKLANLPEKLTLPTDRPYPAIASYKGETIYFNIDKSLHTKLIIIARNNSASLFMVLQSILAILFTKLGVGTDIPFGSPIAGRTDDALNDLVGFFVNTLVLRTDTSGDPSFTELLARVRETNLEAYANQDLPFEHLVEVLNPARVMSHHLLFQVMLVLQNNIEPQLNIPGLLTKIEKLTTSTAKFDLTFDFTELRLSDSSPAGLRGEIEYATDLFNRSTIENLIQRFVYLLNIIEVNSDKRLSEIDLLTPNEKIQIINDWNNTSYPIVNSIYSYLFEQRVLKSQCSIALICNGKKVTYAELNSKANKIAHWLIQKNIGPENIVGLSLPRSPELLICLLGILKAGATYLPLDPEYPSERLEFILNDAKPTCLISTKLIVKNLPKVAFNMTHLNIDDSELLKTIESLSENNPTDKDRIQKLYPQNSAYIIYTSGSTGRPKGVVVSHVGIPSLAASYIKKFQLNENSRLLQFSSINYDPTFCEMCCTLLSGATLIMTHPDILLSGSQQIYLLKELAPTHITFSPTILSSVAELAIEKSTCLMVAGEACPPGLVTQWAKDRLMINAYGPTEATVDALYWECKASDHDLIVPIGRPIFNTKVFVLDNDLKPVPVGIIGELYIEGYGLARGYLNDPQKTAERFVACPFGLPGKRMYRTGDLVRWRKDGALEFIGRTDDQVKIRGIRIEPGEIEAILNSHTAVSHSAVIVREDTPGHKQLLGYVVLSDSNVNSRNEKYEEEQVNNWQDIHEHDYALQKELAYQEDFNGWNSSYNEQPIEIEQMREWHTATVNRILELEPCNVLEIGVGSGLILWKVAPHCKTYCGIDFSPSVINALNQQVNKNLSLKNKVELYSKQAHQIKELPNKFFDTIIINSVAQYFPSAHYLLDVLRKSLDLLNPGGKIYVGDLRNLKLMRCFSTAIALSKEIKNSENLVTIKQIIEHNIKMDSELLFDPEFFVQLKNEFSDISGVSIQIKTGWYHNELTKYRYDVVIYKQDQNIFSVKDAPIYEWNNENFNFQNLSSYLENTNPSLLRLTGIPNGRLISEYNAMKALWQNNSTIDEICSILNEKNTTQEFEPQLFYELGKRLNYQTKITWTDTIDCNQFDVIYIDHHKHNTKDFTDLYVSHAQISSSITKYANNPNSQNYTQLKAAELRKFISEKLPDYMVPSNIIILDSLPLTPNGILDQKALAFPEFKVRKITLPRTENEKIFAKIFIDILGIDKVGIHDRFFDLGGDSIRSLQLVSRAYKCGLIITPRDVFQHQSIETLAIIAKKIEIKLSLENTLSNKNFITDTLNKILETPDPILSHRLFDKICDHKDTIKSVEFELSNDVSEKLSKQLCGLFHVTTKELMLIAFAVVCVNWRQQRIPNANSILRIDIEQNDLIKSIVPLRLNPGQINLLQLAKQDNELFARIIKRVKEQIRTINNNKFDYNQNAYSSNKAREFKRSQISFCYHQNLEGVLENKIEFDYPIKIDIIENNKLEKTTISAKISWASLLFSDVEIKELNNLLINIIFYIIELVNEENLAGFTPSDFPLLQLKKSDIDSLESAYENLQNVLPLAPLQEGFLLHSVYNQAKTDPYQNQTIFELNGLLDIETLKFATQYILERHENLRAGFVFQGFETPLQIILKFVNTPFEVYDLTKLKSQEQFQAYKEILEKDIACKFDLSNPPLIRFKLVCLTKSKFYFIISDHHILLDGWSMPILLKELFEVYFTNGKANLLPKVTPYQDYLSWLAVQDKQDAKEAWSNYLSNLEIVTTISKNKIRNMSCMPEILSRKISKSLTYAITQQASKNKLTLNTILQGLFGLLISEITQLNDIVFGITVSERPAEIPGIENMVGLFINTLPLRLKINSEQKLVSLFENIQEDQWNLLLPFRHLGLTEIQRIVGKGDLFDVYYVFQNYPVQNNIFDSTFGSLSILPTHETGAGVSHYPLGLTVIPGEQLTLMLGYSPEVFNNKDIEILMNRLEFFIEYTEKNISKPLNIIFK